MPGSKCPGHHHPQVRSGGALTSRWLAQPAATQPAATRAVATRAADACTAGPPRRAPARQGHWLAAPPISQGWGICRSQSGAAPPNTTASENSPPGGASTGTRPAVALRSRELRVPQASAMRPGATQHRHPPWTASKTADADEQHGAGPPITVSLPSPARWPSSSASRSSSRRKFAILSLSSGRRRAMRAGSLAEVDSQLLAWHHHANGPHVADR